MGAFVSGGGVTITSMCHNHLKVSQSPHCVTITSMCHNHLNVPMETDKLGVLVSDRACGACVWAQTDPDSIDLDLDAWMCRRPCLVVCVHRGW